MYRRTTALGLVALADGRASALPLPGWQPFGAPALLARLMAAAQPVARLFQPPTAPPLAFPWAFSPWVLVLRSQPELARRARGPEGWLGSRRGCPWAGLRAGVGGPGRWLGQ